MTGSLDTLLPLVAGLAVAGCCAGLIAGLLGVGGGIIFVPVLYQSFVFLDVSATAMMHTAVGSSLACIILTSLSSIRSHWRRGAVDWPLVRAWGPAIAVGCLAGTILASHVHGEALTALFATLALIVATYLTVTPEGARVSSTLPRGILGAAIPSLIGGLSAMVGIGGGTLSVPTLSLCSYPIRRAVGTASAFGLIIAVPGAIGFAVSGWSVPGRPPLSLGYVSLVSVALITPLSVAIAPLGARIAHSVPPTVLRRFFAVFLTLVALRMYASLIL